jgi:hypothetical protein
VISWVGAELGAWVPLQCKQPYSWILFFASSTKKEHRGVYMFFGGALLIISGLLEFTLGNTFSFVVFMSFGAFWLTFAITLQPVYGAYGAYAPPGAASPTEGLATQGFNASFGKLRMILGGPKYYGDF